jgi:isobutyryl-CoA mutase
LTTTKRLLTDPVTLVRLAPFQATARTGGTVFAALLRTVCSFSLGQITRALYEVGGQYRRSM